MYLAMHFMLPWLSEGVFSGEILKGFLSSNPPNKHIPLCHSSPDIPGQLLFPYNLGTALWCSCSYSTCSLFAGTLCPSWHYKIPYLLLYNPTLSTEHRTENRWSPGTWAWDCKLKHSDATCIQMLHPVFQNNFVILILFVMWLQFQWISKMDKCVD